MNLRNNVQLIGNLGQDPTVKEIANDKKVANFSVATSEYYKENDEFKEKTTWHNIVAWGHHAEKVEKKCTKGSEVLINGKIEYRNYTDKEGIKRYVTEIIVNEIICRSKEA